MTRLYYKQTKNVIFHTRFQTRPVGPGGGGDSAYERGGDAASEILN